MSNVVVSFVLLVVVVRCRCGSKFYVVVLQVRGSRSLSFVVVFGCRCC